MQIEAVRRTCIGAGQCVFAAPETFDQDDDGLVVLLREDATTETDLASVRQAVNICPSRSISLTTVPAGN
ncbi:ferredoxin [Arthrobacter sunyaminii]|uniref:Ferredoxin n=1 Tax=Arthrobacter sunyaminii TaxID=2816859 RepID=A0A975S6C1_9MICC|nr:ferredoxin [Arthrobacter sunyaminii]MBO0909821.1 ferredoxin [Arthrobacter sunyaminii]QWQ36611.1 ferredoxin [Arthrobacter sunyaminii]